MKPHRPSGFLAFTTIWLGQLLSTLGTRMTTFALSIWIWQQTGHATDLALMTFAGFLATAVFSPLAGSLIDRWNRRLTIVLSDVGSGAATVLLLVLFATGSAQVWQLYAVNVLTGAFLAFQTPAYSSTISLMMRKGEFPRANAMMSLAQSVPGIFAPTLAVALLAVTDVKVILLADALSYALAILTVFCVAMPSTPRKSASDRQGLWQDSLFGFRYILRRPGLLGLESVVFGIMLIGLMGWTLLTPMIMARTGNSASQVGIVQSLGAVGGVAGGILIGVLKPTPHKIGRILTAILVFSLLGRLLIGLGDSIAVWSIGWCCAWSCLPFILGYSQAIWQEKVAPEAQGRVFAARNLVESVATPIALGIAGPLADHVFEPGMRPGGRLADWFGWLVGTGPGTGMSVIFVLTGILGAGVAALGFALPQVRNLETLLPDHDAPVAEDPVSAGR